MRPCCQPPRHGEDRRRVVAPQQALHGLVIRLWNRAQRHGLSAASEGGMGIACTQIEPNDQLILEKWVEELRDH